MRIPMLVCPARLPFRTQVRSTFVGPMRVICILVACVGTTVLTPQITIAWSHLGQPSIDLLRSTRATPTNAAHECPHDVECHRLG
jgi:hypothetical protein